METLLKCPICSSTNLESVMQIPDHFLTNEIFSISKCLQCGFLFTNPKPLKTDIPKYYQSEDYLSHKLKKLNILSTVYYFARNYSLSKKHSIITKQKTTGSILDIGSGTSEFLSYMKKRGWEAVGIEPLEYPREFAKQKYSLDIYPDFDFDNKNDTTFDVITLWHVLEHVEDLNLYMQKISKLLKNDGLLVIALPNHESWDAKKFGTFWAAWDVPRHLYHFSQTTFHLLLKKYNFDLISTVPLKMDSYYISFLSQKYKSGSSSFFKTIIKGFLSNRDAKKSENNYSSLIYLSKKKKNI